MAKDDDDVWRSIVDNYGDRPALEQDEVPAPVDPPVAPPAAPVAARASWNDEYPDSDWTTDRFVPPPPPPLPVPTTDRYIAWAGVFGSPGILLVSLIFGLEMPELIAYLLVIGFVGGFLYLVFTMTREPRDPGDDGAVV